MLSVSTSDLTTSCYDFHGIFRLAVHSADARVMRHFQAEYGAFEVGSCDTPDLDVTVSPFSVKLPGSAIEFDRFLMTDEWVFARERYKVARWEFALTAPAAGTIRLLFHGGIFSLDFLQHHFVEPLLRYRVCQRAVALVGGGCVVRNGRALLFSGLGHTGKTALALRQVLAGWSFQADDLTFVSSSGETYSYPRRLHITDHMFAACPAAMSHLPLANKLSIKTKKLIYEGTLRYGELQESVRIGQLVPGARIVDAAQLGAVVVLVASAGTMLGEPRALQPAELVDRLMAINGVEGKAFTDLLWACHANGKAVSPAEWWRTEREILQEALRSVPGFELTVPRQAANRQAVLEHTRGVVDELYERLGEQRWYSGNASPRQPTEHAGARG